MKGKRILAVLLTVAMLLSMSVTALAGNDVVNLQTDESTVLTTSLEGDNYTWSGGEPFVSVASNGNRATVTAERPGSTTVTVTVTRNVAPDPTAGAEPTAPVITVGEETWTISIIEKPQPQTQVTIGIDPATLTLNSTESETLNVRFSAGSESDVASWDWRSSDDVAATVSGNNTSAVVTARKAGSTVITAVAYREDGSEAASAQCRVTVKNQQIPVSVTGGGNITISAGATQLVTAHVSGGSGEYDYVWSYEGTAAIQSKSDNAATIYGMDVGTGSVTLTVYDVADRSNFDSDKWNVKVEGNVTPLNAAIAPETVTLAVGGTSSLSVSATGGSGQNSNYSYNWYSNSNKVAVSGNGAVATVTAGGIGSATVSCDVLDTKTNTVKTVSAVVTVTGGSASYNASASATVGSNLPLTTIAGNIASEFKAKFGTAVSGGAVMSFSAPNSSVGMIRAANGNQIKANESITYNSAQALYFLAVANGTFTTPYTLTDGGNTISGNLTINASGGAAVTGATISSNSLDMATYSSRTLSVNVAPSNAAYTVKWTSSNTNIVSFYGSGPSITLTSQGVTGSAVITAVVTGSAGGSVKCTCTVYVTSSAIYNPTLTVTVGSDYYGTGPSDSMAKQFRNVYGYSLVSGDAKISFSSLGNSRYGVLRQSDGSPVRTNVNYAFSEFISSYFEALATGTYSLPYKLSYRGNVLQGTLDIYIRSSNVDVTISQSSMTLATYSNQTLSVSVSPSNVYYNVVWASTNVNIASVTGNGTTATVKTSGTMGTATVYATVTDRNGVEVYRGCTVTVTNRNNTYSPSVSTTIGVPYRGTGTSDAMKSQYRSVYGANLPDSATIRFGSTGNNAVAVMRLKNGAPIKANTNYTLSEYIDMYTDTVAAGTFSVPYTLTYGSNTLSGSVIVNVNAGSVTAALSLTGTQPYVFSKTASDGTVGSNLLNSAITNAMGGNWSYIRFGLTNSSVGGLFRDESHATLASYAITQAELGKLCFVPTGTAGDYSIPFTIYNSADNNLGNGTLYIRVSTNTTPLNITFADVDPSAWYGLSVQWAVSRGITNGMGKNSAGQETFEPTTICKTAHILTFLWRSQGSPVPTIRNPFTNIKETDYFYNAAIWAYEKGLITGTTFEGAFTDCTRAEAVIYMWKLAGKPDAQPSSFSDVTPGTEQAAAVAWAVSKNITSGTGSDANGNPRFEPDTICNRGHIVTFLQRAYA
ncbi:MAG: hypothetical protein E7474_11065 [Ruminococcaceae bacterium]|nr:hypothetical protein [Oscillospiraceae bacterium]